ncbi:hypothetical protein AO411_2003310 [Salmonella enterica subsp. enterica serovar Sarajane]|nr:hypothetical protein AO411_2003310 [Salmonella enterica subsp. enterica serovar Sarajane]
MVRCKVKLKYIFLLTALLAPVAYADWDTQTDDDVFSGGKRAMLLGVLSSVGHNVVFDCSENKLMFSFLEEDNNSMLDAPIPVDLFVKIDDNEIAKLNALMMRRNSKFMGAESSDEDNIIKLLKQLRSAKKKIIVGIQDKDGENRQSYSGDVVNSTSAVSNFVKACNIKL